MSLAMGTNGKFNNAASMPAFSSVNPSAGTGKDAAGLDIPRKSLVVLDARALDRECFVRSISAHKAGLNVLAFASIEEWKRVQDEHPPLSAILLNVGRRNITDESVAAEIRRLSAEFKTAATIVLADSDELSQIMKALEYGARGYIPSNVGIEICVEVIDLVLAGGVFVPASSVFAVRQLLETGGETTRPLAGLFTLRQAEVVEALRRGKANKIIAYELNLRESTVKVHIRNIMKKLKATNRTEVAYKINDLLPSEAQAAASSRPHNWVGERA